MVLGHRVLVLLVVHRLVMYGLVVYWLVVHGLLLGHVLRDWDHLWRWHRLSRHHVRRRRWLVLVRGLYVVVEGRGVGLLRLGKLLKEGLRRVELEGKGGLADSHGGGLLSHLLALQVALERVEEKTVVGNAVPVEDLLLLLCADAVVLV